MKTIVIALICILFSLSVHAEDKKISICSFDWPPHHSPKLINEGYTADIIKAIFEPQGYKITKTFLPWNRAQTWAKEGKKCDAITEIYLNKERLNYYWYGAPYSIHEVYLITLKSNPLKNYTTLKELVEYKFGYNMGGSLSKEFDSADYLTKIPTKGYNNGIKMLLAGRFDFFVSPKSVAYYEAKKDGRLREIHTIGKPLGRQPVYMAFSKSNAENVTRIQDYNRGLFLLFKTGEYFKIVQDHLPYR
jgi:polar amino acid transport system substrate-binding protein